MRLSTDNYKSLIEKYPLPVMILDAIDGSILHVNESALDFYGYSYEEFYSMKISDINTYSAEEVAMEIASVTRAKKNLYDFVHQTKKGDLIPVKVMSYPIEFSDGKIICSIIRENLELENTETDVLNLDFLNVDDPLCVVKESVQGVKAIVEVNRSFLRLIEMNRQDVHEKTITDFLLVEDMADINKSEFNAHLNNNQKNRWVPVNVFCMRFRYKGEEYYVYSFKAKNFYNDQVYSIDVDKIKSHGFDLNRSCYLIEFSMFLNINQERRFNSVMLTLKQNIERLFKEHCLDYNIMRYENSFLVQCFNSLSEIYVALSLLIDLKLSSNKHDCKIRIGVSDKGKISKKQVNSLNQIMKSFDVYEYNEIHTFGNRSIYSKQIDIKKGIKHAIEENEFRLYTQGIVNISTNSIEGYEVLLRWHHPEYGVIMPSDFLPYAELTGEIVEVDMWVIRNILTYINDHLADVKDIVFHVNLSTRTLAERELIPLIREHKGHVNPECIVFEITEDPSTQQMDVAITELRKMGFLLAIDDFGKGYSSFERIKNIGIQFVKIDKSFIEGLTENVDDILILKAIISMCNNLNIKVIAEGIEEVEQLEFLYSRKCYIIQGFIFSKPIHIGDLILEHEKINERVNSTLNEMLSEEITSRKFYNNGRIIIQDIHEDFSFITPNITLSDALSYEFEDFINLSFLDLLPTQYKKTFVKFVKNASEEQDFDAIMLQLIDNKQDACKVICAVSNVDGINHYRLYIEFLESEKEKEMELLGLSHSYLQAFDKAPSGMMIIDDNYSIRKWNESCEKIYGYDLKAAKNSNVVKLLGDEKQQKSLNHLFNRAMHYGQVEMVIDNTNIYDQTIICRWHVNDVFDELNQKHEFICIVNDITDGIRKSREMNKINKAIDQSKSIIVITDVNGQIEYTNNMFSEITGFEKDEIVGKSPNILSSGDQPKSFYRDLWQTILSGDVWEGEIKNRKKDGGFYWAKTNIYPIFEDDEITGFVEIQTDTTKEKELVNQNNNLKSKLFEQDKVASLGLLSSGIMHEINNPLSYVQGNIKYIIEQFEDFSSLSNEDIEDLKDAFMDIDKGVTQIKQIAEGLKKYIFKGELEEKEPVNLVDEIETIFLLAKNEYKYYATVSLEYDESHDYMVEGFASKLKQVFMNLIINASHAIASKEESTLGNIVVSLTRVEHEMIIKVTDDGCGMEMKTIEKIYEPLFTTKEEGIGSGLGLSVSRQIIEEEHGGVILCESEVGKGTTFTIRLPK